MEHFERNETNRIHAGAGSNGHAPKGGAPIAEAENGTWHADCFEGAAQEGSNMEHDTNNTDKEQNTNDENKVLLTEEEIDEGMKAHEGLVRHLAGRMAGARGGEADDDLLQEGRVGLWEGLRRFDKARCMQQSTYVGWWIRRNILRELERRRRYGGFFAASLQDPVGEDGETTRGDLYADTQAADPAEETDWEEALEGVRERMATLRPGDREAVELYFGLKDGTPRTYKEVAESRGYSTTRAHKVVRRALDGLTPPPAA